MAIKTIEQFRVEATSEIESAKPQYVQEVDGANGTENKRERTEAEYEQAIEDLAQWKLYQQDNDYKIARQESFDSIGDQLDMLYHDMTAGKGDKTGNWYKAVKKIKDDNPKPS
tara:strand:+ start:123 stop:461 length:339 start_codon:yes stop_codon:yes gene_type:complete